MSPRKVVILLDPAGRGSVHVDGMRVPNVRAVTVHARLSPYRIPTSVTLELVNVDVSIEADAELVETDVTRIEDRTRRFAMLPV